MLDSKERKGYIERLCLYLLRKEGRCRIRIEVPRKEAVDQLGLQGGRRRYLTCSFVPPFPSYLLNCLLTMTTFPNC